MAVARGEICHADLDPTRGRVQAGKRPVLIVSSVRFNRGLSELAVVIPITSKGKGIRSHVEVKSGGNTGLRTTSYVLCEAIRCVSLERLSKRLGNVDELVMAEVDEVLRMVLEL